MRVKKPWRRRQNIWTMKHLPPTSFREAHLVSIQKLAIWFDLFVIISFFGRKCQARPLCLTLHQRSRTEKRGILLMLIRMDAHLAATVPIIHVAIITCLPKILFYSSISTGWRTDISCIHVLCSQPGKTQQKQKNICKWNETIYVTQIKQYAQKAIIYHRFRPCDRR